MNTNTRTFMATNRELYERHVEIQNLKISNPTICEMLDRATGFINQFYDNNNLTLGFILAKEQALLKEHAVRDGLKTGPDGMPVYKMANIKGVWTWQFKSNADEAAHKKQWHEYLNKEVQIIL